MRLGDYMMRNWPFFQQTVALSTATLQSGNYVRHVTSTDDLLAKVEWIDGIKTGHTSKAGYVLVSQGTRDGFTLIASVLGTPSEAARDASALSLLQWGFSQFHLVTVVRAGKTIVAPKVPYEDAPARIVAAAATGRCSRATRACRCAGAGCASSRPRWPRGRSWAG